MSIAASVRTARAVLEQQSDVSTTFIPPALYIFATSPEHTVTNALANSTPDTPVRIIAEHLYGLEHGWEHHWTGHHPDHAGEHKEKTGLKGLFSKLQIKKKKSDDGQMKDREAQAAAEKEESEATESWAAMEPLRPEQLDEVRRCGKWDNPSELFLNLYAQALRALDSNPLNGLVSPPLMGASGVTPLTIISVIPDIIQHHADLIVRAEHEVFLATNFWEASGAAQTIVDALKELSRRVVEGKRDKVVVKLMYDRGNPAQVVSPHQAVAPKTYTGDRVKLPAPEEIPGLHLQVQNYHVPPVGTFHSKFMVVDRKIAILNSNNIQDRVNVEMMVHYEGPIVQSFYDMALLSWWETFDPPLPLLYRPPVYSGDSKYEFGHAHPVIGTKGDLDSAASKARETLAEHHAQTELPDGQTMQQKQEVWDANNQDEAERVDDGFTTADKINAHLNTGSKIGATDTDPPPNAAAFKPVVLHTEHKPFPIAMVNRSPRGRPGHGDTYVPQDQAWLAAFRFAKKNVFIQTPTFNAKPIVAAALDAVRRGVLVEIYADLGFNDEGELLPFQGGTNEMVAAHMYGELDEAQKDNLRIYWYTGKDQKTPLNAADKSRNCHVKLMIVDGHVGMQGNGNQDSQSWYHSQEINVLVDSELVCREWRDAIDANQNTLHYGRVDARDGVWRDPQGNTLPGQKPLPHGPFKSLGGVVGAVQRVRGEGGF
ncbi:hypothetical protein Q5752_000441 [Cryptotrichosporon argae]